jgi:hypothetical protein
MQLMQLMQLMLLMQRRGPMKYRSSYLLLVVMALCTLCAVSAANCHKKSERKRTAASSPEKAAAATGNVKSGNSPVRYVVRTANLKVKVKTLKDTRKHVEALAKQAGGYIHTAQFTVYASEKRWTATIKVPQAGLEDMLNKLRALGKVLEEKLSTEEVTQAVLDVQARLKNLRTTEQRLQQIALKSTATTEDLLKVEKHLGRVRSKIEQLEAKDRYFAQATSMATIHVEFVLRARKRKPGWWERLGDAFRAGFRHLKELIVVILEAVGHAWLVVLLLAILVIVGIRVWKILSPVLAKLSGTGRPRRPGDPVNVPPPGTAAQPPPAEPTEPENGGADTP